jgi:hypothetical protein
MVGPAATGEAGVPGLVAPCRPRIRGGAVGAEPRRPGRPVLSPATPAQEPQPTPEDVGRAVDPLDPTTGDVMTRLSLDRHQRAGDRDPIRAMKDACARVGSTDPGDVRTIASLHAEMIINYYQDVRRQAQQSFVAALVAATVGTFFFLYAALWPMALSGATLPAKSISLVAGTLIQIISAINFYLYARASRQFATFHICLERMNRFLLANSLCENICSENLKDSTRVDLVGRIANAPLLEMEIGDPGRGHGPQKPRGRPRPAAQVSTTENSKK